MMELVFFFLLLFSSASAFAQFDEDRVTRDASGVHSGKLPGDTLTWVPDGGAPYAPFAGPTNRGRARVPVKDGRVASVLRDSELNGDNSATVKGQAKDPVVLRGGKLIRTGGEGDVINPGSGSSMTDAKLNGTFTGKGPTWFAGFSGQGSQVFDVGEEWVSKVRKITGRG